MSISDIQNLIENLMVLTAYMWYVLQGSMVLGLLSFMFFELEFIIHSPHRSSFDNLRH